MNNAQSVTLVRDMNGLGQRTLMEVDLQSVRNVEQSLDDENS